MPDLRVVAQSLAATYQGGLNLYVCVTRQESQLSLNTNVYPDCIG